MKILSSTTAWCEQKALNKSSLHANHVETGTCRLPLLLKSAMTGILSIQMGVTTNANSRTLLSMNTTFHFSLFQLSHLSVEMGILFLLRNVMGMGAEIPASLLKSAIPVSSMLCKHPLSQSAL